MTKDIMNEILVLKSLNQAFNYICLHSMQVMITTKRNPNDMFSLDPDPCVSTYSFTPARRCVRCHSAAAPSAGARTG